MNEISVNNYRDAMTIASILLKNNNAVMITTEDKLFILNWIYCYGDFFPRNEIVFMHIDDYEERLNDYATSGETIES